LIVALGGTSYAAIKLPKDSVGSKQIKTNAVTTSKVKDGSLQSKDFKSGQLPAGAKGAPGPPGAPGTALAFGRVLANGTVDPARSKDVAVTLHATGKYCLLLPPGAKNIIAQVEAGSTNVVGDETNTTVLPATVASNCPGVAANGLVLFYNGTPVNKDFYVIVN
jgi:hypothetical protein